MEKDAPAQAGAADAAAATAERSTQTKETAPPASERKAGRTSFPLEHVLVVDTVQVAQWHVDGTSCSESGALLWALVSTSTVLLLIAPPTPEILEIARQDGDTGIRISDAYVASRNRENRLRCWPFSRHISHGTRCEEGSRTFSLHSPGQCQRNPSTPRRLRPVEPRHSHCCSWQTLAAPRAPCHPGCGIVGAKDYHVSGMDMAVQYFSKQALSTTMRKGLQFVPPGTNSGCRRFQQ